MEPHKPHSIFPRARRIGALTLTVCGIIGSLWAGIGALSRLRSEYEMLRYEVKHADVRMGELRAACQADDRALRLAAQQGDRAAVQLAVALEQLMRVQTPRVKETPAYHDAKIALERAKALQPVENWP